MKKSLIVILTLISGTFIQNCSNTPNLTASDCQNLMEYKMDNIEEFQIKHHTPEHIEMIEEALKKNDSIECERVLNIVK
jgi:hypothetical protein